LFNSQFLAEEAEYKGFWQQGGKISVVLSILKSHRQTRLLVIWQSRG